MEEFKVPKITDLDIKHEEFGNMFVMETEYWIQKVSIGLMTPGILLIAVGLLVFIGVNVKDLIR